MGLTKVSSSNVAGYEYTESEKSLLIAFTNGTRYAYADVPAEVVKQLAAAESVGKFFYANIKPRFQAKKIV